MIHVEERIRGVTEREGKNRCLKMDDDYVEKRRRDKEEKNWCMGMYDDYVE